MENASLPSDVCSNFTTSSSDDDGVKQYVDQIREFAVEVMNIIIGTVGIIDNLLVIVVFAFFIKITDKVLGVLSYSLLCKTFFSVHMLLSMFKLNILTKTNGGQTAE